MQQLLEKAIFDVLSTLGFYVKLVSHLLTRKSTAFLITSELHFHNKSTHQLPKGNEK